MKTKSNKKTFADVVFEATASTQATSSNNNGKGFIDIAKIREINQAINFASEFASIGALFKGNLCATSMEISTNMDCVNPNPFDPLGSISKKITPKQQTFTIEAITEVVKKSKTQSQYIDLLELCSNPKYNTTRPSFSPMNSARNSKTSKVPQNKFPKELDTIQEVNYPEREQVVEENNNNYQEQQQQQKLFRNKLSKGKNYS